MLSGFVWLKSLWQAVSSRFKPAARNTNLYHRDGKALVRWVDIPKSDINLFKSNDKLIKALAKHIDEYHRHKKDDVSYLPLRVSKLNEIIKHINDNKFPDKFNKQLSKLSLIASRKSSYLSELNTIYDKGLDTYKFLKQYHSVNMTVEKEFYPLYMSHHQRYDLSLPGYWGYFWHESVDPCHRKLPEYYDVWKNVKGEKAPFFMWLETQQVPYHVPTTMYLSDEEIKDINITIKDGKLYNVKGDALHHQTDEPELLFVVTMDHKLLAVSGNDQVHHNSITRGKPVLASGTLKVEYGKPSFVMMYSGHYVPTPQDAHQTLKVFQRLNINISESKVLYFDNNGKEQVSPALQFIKDFEAGLINSPERPEMPTKKHFMKYSSLR